MFESVTPLSPGYSFPKLIDRYTTWKQANGSSAQIFLREISKNPDYILWNSNTQLTILKDCILDVVINMSLNMDSGVGSGSKYFSIEVNGAEVMRATLTSQTTYFGARDTKTIEFHQGDIITGLAVSDGTYMSCSIDFYEHKRSDIIDTSTLKDYYYNKVFNSGYKTNFALGPYSSRCVVLEAGMAVDTDTRTIYTYADLVPTGSNSSSYWTLLQSTGYTTSYAPKKTSTDATYQSLMTDPNCDVPTANFYIRGTYICINIGYTKDLRYICYGAWQY